MFRRVVSLASVLSMLLWMGTAVLWAGSYRKPMAISFGTSRGLWEVAVRNGVFLVDNEPERALDKKGVTVMNATLASMKNKLSRQITSGPTVSPSDFRNPDEGAGEIREVTRVPQSWNSRTIAYSGVSIRCAYVFGLTASLPAAWVIAASRRKPRGHCETCGYNLTGNISGFCPECGMAVKAQVGA